jgi:hypothetical protein
MTISRAYQEKGSKPVRDFFMRAFQELAGVP